MKDPSLPLQAAIVAALEAAKGPGESVLDRVPLDAAGKVKAAFPYYHVGEDQVLSDADQCMDPSTVYATIHIWSRGVGKVEAKQMTARAALALDAKLTVAGFAVIGHKVERLDHLTDLDGVTSHSVLVLRYRLGPVR